MQSISGEPEVESTLLRVMRGHDEDPNVRAGAMVAFTYGSAISPEVLKALQWWHSNINQIGPVYLAIQVGVLLTLVSAAAVSAMTSPPPKADVA